MRQIALALLIATTVATAGCGIIYRQPIYQGNLMEQKSIAQLAVGMTKEQVLNLLGTPSIADPFTADRWDYTASERLGRVGKPVVHNFSVYFTGDTVSKWDGTYFPEQDSALAKDSVKTFGPNLAKEKEKDKAKRQHASAAPSSDGGDGN